jgi:hypothetical protein
MEYRYLYKFVPKNVARVYKWAKKENNGTYSASIKVEKIPYGVIAMNVDDAQGYVGVAICNVDDRFIKSIGRHRAIARMVPFGSPDFKAQLSTFPKAIQRDILYTIYGMHYGKY